MQRVCATAIMLSIALHSAAAQSIEERAQRLRELLTPKGARAPQCTAFAASVAGRLGFKVDQVAAYRYMMNASAQKLNDGHGAVVGCDGEDADTKEDWIQLYRLAGTGSQALIENAVKVLTLLEPSTGQDPVAKAVSQCVADKAVTIIAGHRVTCAQQSRETRVTIARPRS